MLRVKFKPKYRNVKTYNYQDVISIVKVQKGEKRNQQFLSKYQKQRNKYKNGKIVEIQKKP